MNDPGDWRSRRWDATHQRIYDVALDLFREHGFEQVNVAQIAKGAEVSVPTFYAHFPSKEHLIMQVPSAPPMIPPRPIVILYRAQLYTSAGSVTSR